MNKKGEGNIIGSLIVIAIVAIVGLIIMTGAAQNLESVRNTYAVANSTAMSSTSGTFNVTGCQTISNLVIYNGSGGLVPATNYSVIGNYTILNGALVTQINKTTTVAYQPLAWNTSYTCEPFGYGDGGTRGIAGIIIIFGMLAISVVVLEPTIRSKLLDAIGR